MYLIDGFQSVSARQVGIRFAFSRLANGDVGTHLETKRGAGVALHACQAKPARIQGARPDGQLCLAVKSLISDAY